MKKKQQEESLDLMQFETPEEALFQCLLVVSEIHHVCPLCILKSFNEGIALMVRDGALEHGEDPRSSYYKPATGTLQ
jgi:hypothetical protein